MFDKVAQSLKEEGRFVQPVKHPEAREGRLPEPGLHLGEPIAGEGMEATAPFLREQRPGP